MTREPWFLAFEELAADPRIVIPGETELWQKVAELLYTDVEADTPSRVEGSQASADE